MVVEMWSLYEAVVNEHDLLFVALAVGICAVGSLTGVAIVRHSLTVESHGLRRRWLILAGFVTGLTVWTTHFTAMMGYRTDLELKFNIAVALISVLLAVSISVAAWLLGFLGRNQGVLAGVLIGLAIAAAHSLDVHAIAVDGHIHHELVLSIVAILLGVGLSAASGHLLTGKKSYTFQWPAALALFGAIVGLHFAAMAGVTIVSASGQVDLSGYFATSDQLAPAVVGAFLLLLAAAVSFTWHSHTLDRAITDEQARLIKSLEELRRTKDHHHAYVELNPQIAWVADPQGLIIEIAPLWEKIVGIPREEGLGNGWVRPVHPDDLEETMCRWQKALGTGDGDLADTRYRLRMVDGTYRWYRARARPRRDETGAIIAWYGSLEDIDEQVAAELALRASEERYRLASRATNDVIWDWSFEDQQATWAGAHKKVLAYPELNNKTDLSWWLDRIHPGDRARVLASQGEAIEQSADYWNEEYSFLTASGSWIEVKSRCVIVRNSDGEPVRLVGSMLDITNQKLAQEELNWAAYHDPLTRLPNRALYGTRIRSAIDDARSNSQIVALVTLDLNNFKSLNDTLGHAGGDMVLAETAKRLASSLPNNATVARLGGDEFAIVLPGLLEIAAHKEYVQQISDCLVDPVAYQGMSIPISFSAGVAIWPRDATEPDDLLSAADLALYAAKTEMPGTVIEFLPAFKDSSVRRSQMIATARSALLENRVVPHYQLKVDLMSGTVMGWEALLRIVGDAGDVLPPSEIAAAFTDAELSVKITDRMIDHVFADVASWRANGLEPGRMAINVSSADFRQHDLVQRLRCQAERHLVDLSAIDIEVTENVLIGEYGSEVSQALEELRALGVMVALDDFGTGYASLSHLQQLPVDVIKIDKSFIDQIEQEDPKATVVTDAVLLMARRLGLQTVAEGIETLDQARYLRARGCTVGQGYYFGRPLPAAAVLPLLGTKPEARWELDLARAPSVGWDGQASTNLVQS
jgi:diguanylate cyclase (GGDEF)-like protein/PAS domain S-box-containing protein